MRLPNGYGTCYKLGGKRRYPFIARITTGWDNNGKQKLKTIGYYKTKQEGLQALADYHKSPYDLDFNKLTFKEVWYKVIDELKRLVNDNKMSQSNLDGLTFAFNNHLQLLHNRKLIDIKYIEMQGIIDNATVRDTNKKLGVSGKGYMKTVCVKVFEYAINYYEVPINNIAIKLKVGTKEKSDKHKPFTDKEMSILWNMQFNDLVKIILIWCYTGLRPNELFKTKHEDIHLEDNYFITGSKTKAGKNRIIPIHKKIKHLIEYFYYREKYFDIFDKNNNYNKIKREFKKLMDELNMEHTPYDARHTFSTKMDKINANPYILKRILGHSIKDITQSTYIHKDIEDLITEVNKID